MSELEFGDGKPERLNKWAQHIETDIPFATDNSADRSQQEQAKVEEANRLREPAPTRPKEDIDQDPDAATDRHPDAGEAVGGYDRTTAADHDLRVLVAALDDVSGQLAGLTDTLRQQLSKVVDRLPDLEEQLNLAQQVGVEVGQLKDAVRELAKRGLEQGPDLAFSATTQMTTATNDVRHAENDFPSTVTWKKVKAILEKAAGKLWNLISRLVKVKEWSVTGQVGTGVLGFAQTSISVTFGQ